jgi:NAD(P)H-nitrite reductase large subunit
MSHQLNPAAAKLMRQYCEQSGIQLFLQQKVLSIEPQPDHSFQVELQDTRFQIDRVIFCIGVKPDIELAERAGLEVKSGIVVDQFLRTSHPDIFAAGDVAEHSGGYISGLWHAAEFQGMLAGENVLGHAVPYDQAPFRLKCEVFGHYFFSINKPEDRELSQYTVIENKHETFYQCFYYQDNIVKGIIMIDDKERAKQYEQAVREGWGRTCVESSFVE